MATTPHWVEHTQATQQSINELTARRLFALVV
jgi:hypothetical protein